MSKESSIIGVSLFLATEVRNIFILQNVLLPYSNTSLLPVTIVCRDESVISLQITCLFISLCFDLISGHDKIHLGCEIQFNTCLNSP